ncbi:zinc-ribbon domain-containing protein, partial [Dehalococcoidia bacterium]|nr:zinc-ribbon domain-containing protein [Dehalococcoidia bacterium]
MPYCSACGSKMEDNERFCASCGEQQRPEVRVAPDRRPPARKARGLLLILIPLVLIAVVAGVIVLRPAPVITVPGDYPTIQAAIDAAEDGDV